MPDGVNFFAGNEVIWLELTACLVLAIVLPIVFDRLGIRTETEDEAIPVFYRRPWVWIQKNAGFCTFYLVLGGAWLISLRSPFYGEQMESLLLLATVWFVLSIAISFLSARFWQDSVLFFVYLATAFLILDMRGPMAYLDTLVFPLGSIEITARGLVAGAITLVLTIWIALGIARLAENRIESVKGLNPSIKVLVHKFIRIILLALALVIAISSMGVDLTVLTIFSGAIGLGLGFGLQKVVSNFVCGFILLTDHSVKPGDVIEIGETYGWINNLRGRYVSVITRDGTEHLIPNEDLVTQRVVNWSYTNNLVRIRTPIGISYKSDPHQAIKIIREVADKNPRVLKKPEPTVQMRAFGDSSLDLELRCWINDPVNGIGNVRSSLLLDVWDAFKKHDIEIPFPQRDVHIRSR